MKKSLKMLSAALFAVVALLAGSSAKAQDAPPAGGFKNAYLNLNKSGKVVLTYTLWKDQIGKGKYTLAFFWASWSDEAREEAATIQSIHQKYAAKGLSVLGVTYEDEIQDSMDAITELGLKFPSIVDVEEQIAGPFDIGSIPYTVLLGPDGKPVATDLHGDAIEAAVKEALKL